MHELDKILSDSIKEIGATYFQLPIDGNFPIYRERVYCYELYHQMRLRWQSDCKFFLNGEVNKSGHLKLREIHKGDQRADKKIPDFLVHTPGHMGGNHAIIEVKSSNLGAAGIEKDLQTLDLFTKKVGYERAVYLVYGHQAQAKVHEILDKAATFAFGREFQLWIHSEARAEPVIHNVG